MIGLKTNIMPRKIDEITTKALPESQLKNTCLNQNKVLTYDTIDGLKKSLRFTAESIMYAQQTITKKPTKV